MLRIKYPCQKLTATIVINEMNLHVVYETHITYGLTNSSSAKELYVNNERAAADLASRRAAGHDPAKRAPAIDCYTLQWASDRLHYSATMPLRTGETIRKLQQIAGGSAQLHTAEPSLAPGNSISQQYHFVSATDETRALAHQWCKTINRTQLDQVVSH